MRDRSRRSALGAGLRSLDWFDRLVRYHPVYYRKASQIIQDVSDADQQTKRQLAGQLREKIIQSALGTVYGKGRSDDFESWPILSKRSVQERPVDFMSRSVIRVPASTGGSTGVPLKLVRSIASVSSEQVFLDNLLYAQGLRLGDARIVVLRADEIKDLSDTHPPYGVYRNGGRRLLLSNAHLSRASLEWFVNEIRNFGADVLWVYPSMLANLVALLKEACLKLKVPIVLSSSETVTAESVKLFEKELSCTFIDYYGQGERVCFAHRDQSGRYWFDPAYGFVELLLDADRSIQSDHLLARIIATGYWNHAMPLIRYDTGDWAILRKDLKEKDLSLVADGLLPFEGIAGRTGEYISGAGGKRIAGLNHLPRGVDHLIQMQIAQESSGKVEIRLLSDKGFGNRELAVLEGNIRQLIPPEISCSIVKVRKLESLPNGKTPFVIRRGDLERSI